MVITIESWWLCLNSKSFDVLDEKFLEHSEQCHFLDQALDYIVGLHNETVSL